MKNITNRITSKQIVLTVLLVITHIGIANAVPTAFEKSSIEQQITNFRSAWQSCQGWWFPPANSVFLNNGANEVAQYYSNYMADHGGAKPTEIIQTMLNNELNNVVAIETKIHSSNQPNHQQALTEWMNTFHSCNELMLTGQSWAGIGVGKSKSSSGQLYWSLIIFKKARLSSIEPMSLNQMLSSNVPHSLDVFGVNMDSKNIPVRGLRRTDADLIITDFERIGTVKEIHNNYYESAVRVVVENQGTVAATTFRIGTWESDFSTTRAVPFTVPGQSNTRMPLTSTTLYPGESITIEGRIGFHPALTGKKVKLFAVADDCSTRDDFDYCRVHEADENNNDSEILIFNNPYSPPISAKYYR